MFTEFYGLSEQPFGVTPDPRYLYFTPAHREALASLFYGIETERGFLALIAQPGMGKTTLLSQLLERLKEPFHSAFISQTQCDSRELVRYVLDAFGLDGSIHDFVQMHAQLNAFLSREARASRRVVLVIDEAQNLSDSVLETVRLLSNFEAPNRKPLHIVLSGQPELAERLLQPSLAQLRQRIAVLARLDPLPPASVVSYIRHRLGVAGYSGPDLFTVGALSLIAERSQGIPRNINNICFNALSLGCAMGCKRISAEVVQEATADLSLYCLVQEQKTPFAHATQTAAPPVIPAHPAKPPSAHHPFSINRNSRLLVRTAALAAVLGGVAIYLGQFGAGRAQSSAPIAQGGPNSEQPGDLQPALSGSFPGSLGASPNRGANLFASLGREASSPATTLAPSPADRSTPVTRPANNATAARNVDGRRWSLPLQRPRLAKPAVTSESFRASADTIALSAAPIIDASEVGGIASKSPQPPPGGNYETPVLLQRVDPAYSDVARNARLEGVVEMTATIGKDGVPAVISYVRGNPQLAVLARDAVRKWRYQPALLNGQPIESQATINVTFQLQR